MESRSGKKKKKIAVNVVEYGKQNPQAASESGTLRNTALRI